MVKRVNDETTFQGVLVHFYSLKSFGLKSSKQTEEHLGLRIVYKTLLLLSNTQKTKYVKIIESLIGASLNITFNWRKKTTKITTEYYLTN